MTIHHASCECGNSQSTIRGPALMRGYCHCTICQEFNQADFADITLYRARDVEMPEAGQVEFRCWKKPRLILRGACRDCGKPAIEDMRIPGLPPVVIVPTGNISGPVPDPSLHIFYHSRVADVNDNLPKISGFLRSQLSFSRHLLASLIRQ